MLFDMERVKRVSDHEVPITSSFLTVTVPISLTVFKSNEQWWTDER
jgi:hypothetical protein